MSDWRPIETVPKGDWLLLWNKNGWQLGFLRSDDTWFMDGGAEADPTHWMCLPPAPKQQP